MGRVLTADRHDHDSELTHGPHLLRRFVLSSYVISGSFSFSNEPANLIHPAYEFL